MYSENPNVLTNGSIFLICLMYHQIDVIIFYLFLMYHQSETKIMIILVTAYSTNNIKNI